MIDNKRRVPSSRDIGSKLPLQSAGPISYHTSTISDAGFTKSYNSNNNNHSLSPTPTHRSAESPEFNKASINGHVSSDYVDKRPDGRIALESGMKSNMSRSLGTNLPLLPKSTTYSNQHNSVLSSSAPSSSNIIIARKSTLSSTNNLTTPVNFNTSSMPPFQGLEIGLQNLGNTCFMNSSLQCLLHIEPLVSYFLQGKHLEDLNTASPTKGNLAMSFAHLTKDISSASGTAVSPSQFQKTVGSFAPHLLDYQQQDCQEFLRFLLDGMSEDLCRRRNRGGGGGGGGTSSSTAAAALIETNKSPKLTTSLDSNNSNHYYHDNLASSPVRSGQGQGQGQGPAVEDRDRQRQIERQRSSPPTTSSSSLSTSSAMRVRGPKSGSVTVSRLRSQATSTHTNTTTTSSKSDTSSNNGSSTMNVESPHAVPVPVPASTGPSGLSSVPSPPITKSISFLRTKIASPLCDQIKIQLRGGGSGSGSGSGTGGGNKIREQARVAWDRYLEKNDSIITDLFAGQLQSTIECSICHNRSSCFDPFLDLSVPIPKNSELTTTSKGWRRSSTSEASKCTLDECLDKFVCEEVLDGDNIVQCDHCKKKTKNIKRMFVYRYPTVLVIHIKRFRYTSFFREKLSTDVTFPLSRFDLTPYLSPDRPDNNTTNIKNGLSSSSITHPEYDLIGVSHHSGSMNGGHYIAHADTSGGAKGPGGSKWMCFNDARVSTASATSLSGPTAYVLFYRLRNNNCI
eukprot:gene6843-13859_t